MSGSQFSRVIGALSSETAIRELSVKERRALLQRTKDGEFRTESVDPLVTQAVATLNTIKSSFDHPSSHRCQPSLSLQQRKAQQHSFPQNHQPELAAPDPADDITTGVRSLSPIIAHHYNGPTPDRPSSAVLSVAFSDSAPPPFLEGVSSRLLQRDARLTSQTDEPTTTVGRKYLCASAPLHPASLPTMLNNLKREMHSDAIKREVKRNLLQQYSPRRDLLDGSNPVETEIQQLQSVQPQSPQLSYPGDVDPVGNSTVIPKSVALKRSANWLAFWGAVQDMRAMHKQLLDRAALDETQFQRVREEAAWNYSRFEAAVKDVHDLKETLDNEQAEHAKVLALERIRIDDLLKENQHLAAKAHEMRRLVTLAESAMHKMRQDTEAAQRVAAKAKADLEQATMRHAIEVVKLKHQATTLNKIEEEKETRRLFLEEECSRMSEQLKTLTKTVEVLSTDNHSLQEKVAVLQANGPSHQVRGKHQFDGTSLQQLTQKSFEKRENELLNQIIGLRRDSEINKGMIAGLKFHYEASAVSYELLVMEASDVDATTGVPFTMPRRGLTQAPSSPGIAGKGKPKGKSQKPIKYVCGPFPIVAVSGKEKELELYGPDSVADTTYDATIDAYRQALWTALPDVAASINQCVDGMWGPLNRLMPSNSTGSPEGEKEKLHKTVHGALENVNNKLGAVVDAHMRGLSSLLRVEKELKQQHTEAQVSQQRQEAMRNELQEQRSRELQLQLIHSQEVLASTKVGLDATCDNVTKSVQRVIDDIEREGPHVGVDMASLPAVLSLEPNFFDAAGDAELTPTLISLVASVERFLPAIPRKSAATTAGPALTLAVPIVMEAQQSPSPMIEQAQRPTAVGEVVVSSLPGFGDVALQSQLARLVQEQSTREEKLRAMESKLAALEEQKKENDALWQQRMSAAVAAAAAAGAARPPGGVQNAVVPPDASTPSQRPQVAATAPVSLLPNAVKSPASVPQTSQKCPQPSTEQLPKDAPDLAPRGRSSSTLAAGIVAVDSVAAATPAPATTATNDVVARPTAVPTTDEAETPIARTNREIRGTLAVGASAPLLPPNTPMQEQAAAMGGTGGGRGDGAPLPRAGAAGGGDAIPRPATAASRALAPEATLLRKQPHHVSSQQNTKPQPEESKKQEANKNAGEVERGAAIAAREARAARKLSESGSPTIPVRGGDRSSDGKKRPSQSLDVPNASHRGGRHGGATSFVRALHQEMDNSRVFGASVETDYGHGAVDSPRGDRGSSVRGGAGQRESSSASVTFESAMRREEEAEGRSVGQESTVDEETVQLRQRNADMARRLLQDNNTTGGGGGVAPLVAPTVVLGASNKSKIPPKQLHRPVRRAPHPSADGPALLSSSPLQPSPAFANPPPAHETTAGGASGILRARQAVASPAGTAAVTSGVASLSSSRHRLVDLRAAQQQQQVAQLTLELALPLASGGGRCDSRQRLTGSPVGSHSASTVETNGPWRMRPEPEIRVTGASSPALLLQRGMEAATPTLHEEQGPRSGPLNERPIATINVGVYGAPAPNLPLVPRGRGASPSRVASPVGRPGSAPAATTWASASASPPSSLLNIRGHSPFVSPLRPPPTSPTTVAMRPPSGRGGAVSSPYRVTISPTVASADRLPPTTVLQGHSAEPAQYKPAASELL